MFIMQSVTSHLAYDRQSSNAAANLVDSHQTAILAVVHKPVDLGVRRDQGRVLDDLDVLANALLQICEGQPVDLLALLLSFVTQVLLEHLQRLDRFLNNTAASGIL